MSANSQKLRQLVAAQGREVDPVAWHHQVSSSEERSAQAMKCRGCLVMCGKNPTRSNVPRAEGCQCVRLS